MKSFIDPQPPATRGRGFAGGPEPTKAFLLCQAPNAVASGAHCVWKHCFVFRCCAPAQAWSNQGAYATHCPLLLCCCIHGPVPLFAVCLAAKRDMPVLPSSSKQTARTHRDQFISVFSHDAGRCRACLCVHHAACCKHLSGLLAPSRSIHAPRLLLPEVEFSAIRSQGPGGQNVNKVSQRRAFAL